MNRVREVIIARDAYLVCSQHVHTTDGEEVMGLLVGCYTQYTDDLSEEDVNEQVICDISHAVILRRSDKRKDRVEISPEMLIQAQQKAEEISCSTVNGEKLHIVGWYHSHPKITVAPSAVDLRTQMGYQQMDDRFVGIIFSVFNKSETNKVHDEVVGAFQAIHRGGNSYERRNVPIRIRPAGGIAPHNQESLCSLSNILQQEQMAVLQQSRDLLATSAPLQHIYNSAVAVQRVVELCEQIPGPLCSLLHSRSQHFDASVSAMDAHIHYLTKLIKDNSLEQKLQDMANIKQKRMEKRAITKRRILEELIKKRKQNIEEEANKLKQKEQEELAEREQEEKMTQDLRVDDEDNKNGKTENDSNADCNEEDTKNKQENQNEGKEKNHSDGKKPSEVESLSQTVEEVTSEAEEKNGLNEKENETDELKPKITEEPQKSQVESTTEVATSTTKIAETDSEENMPIEERQENQKKKKTPKPKYQKS